MNFGKKGNILLIIHTSAELKLEVPIQKAGKFVLQINYNIKFSCRELSHMGKAIYRIYLDKKIIFYKVKPSDNPVLLPVILRLGFTLSYNWSLVLSLSSFQRRGKMT